MIIKYNSIERNCIKNHIHFRRDTCLNREHCCLCCVARTRYSVGTFVGCQSRRWCMKINVCWCAGPGAPAQRTVMSPLHSPWQGRDEMRVFCEAWKHDFHLLRRLSKCWSLFLIQVLGLKYLLVLCLGRVHAPWLNNFDWDSLKYLLYRSVVCWPEDTYSIIPVKYT